MKNVWLRIGLGAGAIALIGIILVQVVKAGKDRVVSFVEGDADISVPLLGVVPFQVGTARLGDLRRVTLLRDAPHHLSGVNFVARIGDSASIDPLKDCGFLTLEGYQAQAAGAELDIKFNENTRFKCLSDSAGFTSFGTVEVRHQQGKEETTLRRTLILTPEVIAEIQRAMSSRRGPDGVQAGIDEDSLSAAIDSITNAALQRAEAARAAAEGGRAARRTTVQSAPAAPAPPATP
jgi:hypothetical protein